MKMAMPPFINPKIMLVMLCKKAYTDLVGYGSCTTQKEGSEHV